MQLILSCPSLLLLPGCSHVAPVSVTNPTVERDGVWSFATLEASGFDTGKYGTGIWRMSGQVLAEIVAAAP